MTITQRMIDLANRLLHNSTELKIIGRLDSTPSTEKDKPSASSNLSYHQLLRRMRKAFPKSAGFETFGILDTNSMEPLIDDNSLVSMERLGVSSILRPGMICLYDGDYARIPFFRGRRVMHRITKVDGDKIYFKGDNNKLPDGWVKREGVLYNLVAIGYFKQDEEGD